jgi:hypothetical protein
MLRGMELDFLLLSAAIGAVAGGFGWFVTRNAKNPARTRTKIIRIASIVAGITIGLQVVAPLARDRKMKRDLHTAALDTYGNEEAAALNTTILLPIVKDPRFEKRIKQVRPRPSGSSPATRKDSWGSVADLVAAGMARLETADLAALFDVKRVLADKSPALCGGFWTGDVSPENLKSGMRSLTKEQQTVWITVSGRALALEVAANGPPPTATGTAGQDAMTELARSLSPDQQAAFSAAAQPSPSPAVACKGFRALAAGMQQLSPEKRGAILHLLAAPPTGDAR